MHKFGKTCKRTPRVFPMCKFGNRWRARRLGFSLSTLPAALTASQRISGQAIEAVQLDFLKQEATPVGSLAELLSLVNARLQQSEAKLLNVDPQSLYALRTVGRRALPTTVIGLLVHLAEHTSAI